MRSHLARTTKLDTPLLGPLATFTRPGSDQLALEFGQAAKHGEHQSAMSGRGIGPSILERFEAGAALADLIEHVEQVARRSGQPIKPHDHEHVARLKPADCLRQFGPVRLGPRHLLFEDLRAAGSHQLGVLSGQVLITGRNPRISIHWHDFTYQYEELSRLIYAGINCAQI